MRNGPAALHTDIRTINARLTPCWARRWTNWNRDPWPLRRIQRSPRGRM